MLTVNLFAPKAATSHGIYQHVLRPQVCKFKSDLLYCNQLLLVLSRTVQALVTNLLANVYRCFL